MPGLYIGDTKGNIGIEMELIRQQELFSKYSD